MQFYGYYMLILCLLQLEAVHCAKILGFFATISRSHFIVQEPVMRELAKRGHQVTVVSTFKQSEDPLKNYRYIEISDFNERPELKDFHSSAISGLTDRFNVWEKYRLMDIFCRLSIDVINHEKFHSLKEEKFDLLVFGWFMNNYALGLSGYFNCPSVVISPNVNFYMMRQFSGNPNSVSTIPFIFSNYVTPMTFFQRLKNAGVHILEYAILEGMSQFFMKPLYLEAFPQENFPSYDDVVKNVSLILLAQHFSGRTPEPLLPNVIEVEGMHVKKEPSPLPEDIQHFLDNATDGAIFFSLGTNARSSDLSPEKISIFLRKFRSLKLKVLWKFEENLPKLPDNVKIGKWLPQDDILRHPNVKLFISHCGKGSITEARYHAVPILGIPLFADQFGNADHIAEEGWAIVLPLTDLNQETFSKTLDEVLSNPVYGNVVKKLSNLNRDRPEHPLDTAAFWIEYVIRHDGAKHMQSPAVHLNFLQYYMVDVFSFIFATLYVVLRMIKIFFKAFRRIVSGDSNKKVKKD